MTDPSFYLPKPVGDSESAFSLRTLPCTEWAEIAIVILNWNQLVDTSECLESLRLVRSPAFRVFLVDNGSSDGSVDELAARFPEICIIRNSDNLGYAEGNNIGIRKALDLAANYVLLLNNDTAVHSDFLVELRRAAERIPHAGILGAKVVYHNRPEVLWALGGNLEQPFARIRMLGRDEDADLLSGEIQEFDHVPGAVMFVRAEVFKQIGLLDTEFFLNWEDAEFCVRAQRAGWKVLGVPGALVGHKVSRATAGKIATYFGQRNRLLFTSKCLPRWQFLLVVVPFHLARLAVLVITQALNGRIDLVKAAVLGTSDFFRGRLGKGSMASVQRF